MKKWTLENQRCFPIKYVMSPYNEPRLTVEPGERITLEVSDSMGGRVQKEGDKPDPINVPYPNPVTGPIYVKGAEKGDTLIVDIHDLQPLRNTAVTKINNWWWYFMRPEARAGVDAVSGMQFPQRLRIMPIKDGRVWFNEKIGMPFSPDIGSIGTAPEVEAILSVLPGPHGGNLDFPEITTGSKIYFPVNVPGALLHLCDAHARRGDMLFNGCSCVMEATATMTLGLVKGKKINWPRIETPTHIMATAASGPGITLEDAMRIAYVELVLWLTEYGFDKWDAYELTNLCTVRVGNPWTVGAKFPKEYLDKA